MPQLTPFHLSFHSGLHVGAGVENLNETLAHVPSDTLFSALVEMERLSGNDVAIFLKKFLDGDPPFRMTSAFPFAGGVRFFPMPVDLRALFSPTLLSDFEWNKPLKRLRYISEGILRLAMTTQEPLDSYLVEPDQDELKGFTLQNGSAWLLIDEIPKLPETMRTYHEPGNDLRKPITMAALRTQKIWKIQGIPRVSVDRISSTPNLFQAERVVFSRGCGLWFGLVGEKDHVLSLLNELGTQGIGGERAVGYGAFQFEEQMMDAFDDLKENGVSLLLSRYSPSKEEVKLLQQPQAAYRMTAISGYLRSLDGAAQRRKRLWLLEEGSLVPGAPIGEIKDVTPQYKAVEGILPHNVYRSGLVVALDWQRSPSQGEVTHA